MKVVHICHPAQFGGLESVLEMLSSGLTQLGHQVSVVAVLSEGSNVPPFLDRMEAAGVRLLRLEIQGGSFSGERLALRHELHALSPDVVNTHGYRADVLASGVARSMEIPVVSTTHGFTGGGWRNRLYEWLQIRSLRNFDAVIAVSAPIVERLRRAGVPPGRIHLIRNSFAWQSPPLSRSEARRELGIGDSEFVTGWIGRMSAEKGPDVMLHAALRLHADGCSTSFIGDGPLRRQLEAEVVAHNSAALPPSVSPPARIRFHGRMEEGGRYINAFDLLAITSRTEGTPIVLLEAISAGVPVVTSRVGGIPDVVSPREAALFESEDEDSLVQNVLRLRRDPALRTSMVQSARDRVEHTLGYAAWLASYETAYNSVLTHNPLS